MAAAIEAMRRGFAAFSAGRAVVPLRQSIAGDGGVTLVMPARLEDDVGAKLVSVFEGNRDAGLPVVSGAFLLLDGRTGLPRAVLEAGALTAIRTGAASGLATDLLARPAAGVLAVFGAGVQARTQVEAVRAVRPVREVRVIALDADHAAGFAAELEGVDARAVADPAEALRGADIVVTATTSAEPVFPAGAVEPGCHINGVGSYTPEMREVPGELVGRARVVVDSREAALAEAGDIVGAIAEGRLAAEDLVELGEIVNGSAPGRQADGEVTFFKSVGLAVQDIALAGLVADRAEANGLGRVAEL